MPCRILIADDHSALRKTLRTTLEAHPGWEVCGEAINGVDATEKAAELRPDVLILDFSMPVMNGIEAARRILSGSPRLPILLFTNHAYTGLDTEAHKIGIRRVITKESDGLVGAIETLLDKEMQSAMDTVQVGAGSKSSEPSPAAKSH